MDRKESGLAEVGVKNIVEMLLVQLKEECAEVIVEVSKAERFGLDEVKSGGTLSNRERIVQKLNDLYAVVNLLVMYRVIPDYWQDPGQQHVKMCAVEKWNEFSNTCGTLEPI